MFERYLLNQLCGSQTNLSGSGSKMRFFLRAKRNGYVHIYDFTSDISRKLSYRLS